MIPRDCASALQTNGRVRANWQLACSALLKTTTGSRPLVKNQASPPWVSVAVLLKPPALGKFADVHCGRYGFVPLVVSVRSWRTVYRTVPEVPVYGVVRVIDWSELTLCTVYQGPAIATYPLDPM